MIIFDYSSGIEMKKSSNMNGSVGVAPTADKVRVNRSKRLGRVLKGEGIESVLRKRKWRTGWIGRGRYKKRCDVVIQRDTWMVDTRENNLGDRPMWMVKTRVAYPVKLGKRRIIACVLIREPNY